MHLVRGDSVCAIPVFPTDSRLEIISNSLERRSRRLEARFAQNSRKGVVFDFGQFRRGPPDATECNPQTDCEWKFERVQGVALHVCAISFVRVASKLISRKNTST